MLSLKDLKDLRRIFETKELVRDLDLIKAIGSPARFRIMVILSRCPDGATVTEIAEVLEATVSRISHQLAVLRKLGVVNREKKNREAIYSMNWKRFMEVQARLARSLQAEKNVPNLRFK